MARPKLGAAPTAEELSTLRSAAEVYAVISLFAQTAGTLPKWLSLRRLAALLEVMATGTHTMTALAAMAEQSQGRVSQLHKKALRAAEQAT